MADDQPTRSGEPDDSATEAMPPVNARAAGSAGGDVPETPAGGAPQPPDPNRTGIIPPVARPPVDPNATQVVSNDDLATRPISNDDLATRPVRSPAPDPTSVMPPVPAATPSWRGSAVPRPAQPESDGTAMWTTPRPTGRAWWLPIVLGIVGLLIIVGVAFVLVAAMKGTSTPAPTSTPTAPTATPTTAIPTPTPSVAPTTPSAAPSTPSAAPSTASPAPGASYVIVPTTLNGLLLPDAESALDALGLSYTTVAQTDSTDLATTVLSTNPAGGTAVPPGTSVIITYAQPPAPSPSASLPSPPPSA